MGDLIRRARSFIYEKGRVIASTLVEALLFPRSWVPTVVSRHYILTSITKLIISEHICREAQPVRV